MRGRHRLVVLAAAVGIAATFGSVAVAQEEGSKDAPVVEAADPALATIDAFIAKQDIDTSKKGWKFDLPKPPKASFDASKRYLWKLDTSEGPVTVSLLPATAPMHASSTIYLTQLGFYDDLVFHRVIPSFMAQGGDPRGNGSGGPGYSYDGEFDPSVKHDRPGLLSMANRGPGTDGSQFFLTFKATSWLDGKHTIFGEVIEDESFETLKKIEALGSRSGRTRKDVQLRSAKIVVE